MDERSYLMIYVDVFLPVIDKTYDFTLDENAAIGVLIEEVAEIITQKEQCKFDGKIKELIFCTEDMGNVMAKNKTLIEYGIHTGSRIIMA